MVPKNTNMKPLLNYNTHSKLLKNNLFLEIALKPLLIIGKTHTLPVAKQVNKHAFTWSQTWAAIGSRGLPNQLELRAGQFEALHAEPYGNWIPWALFAHPLR